MYTEKRNPQRFTTAARLAVADLYGQQRAALKVRGLPIGAKELLIGCHALHLGRVLVTQNRRKFERLEDLQVESWVDCIIPELQLGGI